MENATDSPYQPPTATVRDQPAYKKPAPIKAVIVGVVVDQVATTIFQFAVFSLYGLMLVEEGLGPKGITQAFDSLGWGSWPRIIIEVGGLAISVLAGYLCARIARQRIFRTTLIMAALDVGWPLPFVHDFTVPRLALMISPTATCVFIGAWLWVMTGKRSTG